MMENAQIKPAEGLDLYERMLRIRLLSEHILEVYRDDVMETPVHLTLGQEAVAVGVCAHLRDEDVLSLGHRTHAGALAKGLPLKSLLAELYGRSTGCSGSYGGSMHVYDPEHGIHGSSAIVGGNIALGVGAALSFKLQSKEGVAVSMFGDGACDAGVFWESMNYAALAGLPVLFLLEDNQLSNVMPKSKHLYPDPRAIAANFMPTYFADGTDAISVFLSAKEAISEIRRTGRPAFLHCPTKRWMKHQGVEEEDLPFIHIDREKDCPIQKLESFLLGARMATPGELKQVRAHLEEELEAAIHYARQSPYPPVQALEV
ncbi:MAG TPA: thiamine pyrophosphate-dependent dehydrogenase E1 component subunit alpha [Planctomycetes bacterium]|nr:thiamine pyrophosphate-dependent dehydrogenase E1 component subunit alpha [Planctomycetota bacterium]